MDTTSVHQFHWLDSLTCILMLFVSIGIGIYYGFFRVAKNTQDYLMGGRKMSLVPITLSLIASFISSISIMGIPAEIYAYGSQFISIIFGVLSSSVLLNYFYLPVFYDLQIMSVFEYLERRFDSKLRCFGTVLFTLLTVSWLPIVTYVPALAIHQVTEMNVYVTSTIICTICIFYTSLGGIKAVVWSDVFQAFSIFGALFIFAIKGTYDIGSFELIWERNINSTRIEPFDFNPNPLIRHTFWSLGIGGCFHLALQGGITQTMSQRYMSLPSYKSVQKALIMYAFGVSLVFLVSSYAGFLMYAIFYDCEPWLAGLVEKKEQILIVFVMNVMNNSPGLLGLFIAGILSAAQSTLSTSFNSMSVVVVQDFYSFFSSKPLTERQSSIIMKLTIVIMGIVCVLLIFVIEKLGSILQLAVTACTVGNGPAMGIFTIGVLLPWIKSKGALIGGVTSLAFMTWLNFRAQLAIAAGELVFEEKPYRTDGCSFGFTPRNLTNIMPQSSPSIYQISYMWYTTIGMVITIVVGFLGSLILESLDPTETDINLLSPCIRRFFKKTKSKHYNDMHYELSLGQNDDCGETNCITDIIM